MLQSKKGFTLIELLLVVVIIGLLLAVIVPRAWRANIDTKYGLVRQNCAELAKYAHLWAEKAIEAQDPTGCLSTLADYYASLAGVGNASAAAGGPLPGMWIARNATNSWRRDNARFDVIGRFIGGLAKPDPEDSVESTTPIDKIPKNPFNAMNVYASPQNDPGIGATPIPGAIFFGGMNEGAAAQGGPNWYYFAFGFQGTDSANNTVTDTTCFHGGFESDTLYGLRNGYFVARYKDNG